MKAGALIALADQLCANPFSTEVKLLLINQIERKIQVELMGLSAEEVEDLTSEELNTADLCQAGRDPMYLAWMKTQYYWNMGEYDVYQNEKAMFEQLYNEMAADICNRDSSGSCGKEYVYGSTET